MQRLAGRTAVVTGGGSGIGAGIARHLAARGMKIVVADIDEAAARAVARAIGGPDAALGVGCDVSRLRDLEALRDSALEAFGSVHVVCNNAGVWIGGPLRDMTPGDWDWVLGVNVMGVVNGSSVFAPLLVEQGEGHVVNTASVGGLLADPTGTPYTTSKAAVIAFTEALRIELEPAGVGVTALCPGPIATALPDSDRLRPASAGESAARSSGLSSYIREGLHPDAVAPFVERAILENPPYMFVNAGALRPIVEARFRTILEALEREGA